jgi:hypothetical protein
MGRDTDRPVVVVRRLRASDLGWFEAARRAGRVAGRQRAINFNADIIERILTAAQIESGAVSIACRRATVSGQVERRPLEKNEKNWRLMGPMVRDKDLEGVDEDDLMVMMILPGQFPELTWDVVVRDSDPDRYARVDAIMAPATSRSTAVAAAGDDVHEALAKVLPWLLPRRRRGSRRRRGMPGLPRGEGGSARRVPRAARGRRSPSG